MSVYAIGTIFVQLTLGMNAFITAQGFAKTGMLTVLIGAVCNIVLDPLFIFVFHMGVRGAALATILSQGVSCVWVCAFLRGKKTLLRLEKRKHPPAPEILPAMHRAWRAVFYHAGKRERHLGLFFNTSLLKYGGDIAVGAMTILTSVMQFAMLPLQGLAQGAQPISEPTTTAQRARAASERRFSSFLSRLLFTRPFSGVQSRYSRVYSPQSLRRMKSSSSLRRKRFESTAACWCFSAFRSPAR